MGVKGLPDLAPILMGLEFLHMLPCSRSGEQRVKDRPNLLRVSEEGRGEGFVVLEGILFFVKVCVFS